MTQIEFTNEIPAGDIEVRGRTYDLTRDTVTGALFAMCQETGRKKQVAKGKEAENITPYRIRCRIALNFGDGRDWHKV